MARFITLTQHDYKGHPRINLDNIGWYVRRDGFEFTRVILRTSDEDGSDYINVLETPEEIDALIQGATS